MLGESSSGYFKGKKTFCSDINGALNVANGGRGYVETVTFDLDLVESNTSFSPLFLCAKETTVLASPPVVPQDVT